MVYGHYNLLDLLFLWWVWNWKFQGLLGARTIICFYEVDRRSFGFFDLFLLGLLEIPSQMGGWSTSDLCLNLVCKIAISYLVCWMIMNMKSKKNGPDREKSSKLRLFSYISLIMACQDHIIICLLICWFFCTVYSFDAWHLWIACRKFCPNALAWPFKREVLQHLQKNGCRI